MQVIVVASRKGGAGKTTLTSHLAVEAERQGVTTVIMDTDPQGGLAAWWNTRQATTPRCVSPASGELRDYLLELERASVDLVIIDTPPAITDSIAATIAVADLVLVPARPSPNDLRAVPGTVALVEAAGKPLVFVINAVKSRVRLTGEAAIALSHHGVVADAMVWDRSGYADAMTNGQTAPELEPQGKAADEIARLWTFIALRLKRSRGGRGVETRAA